MARSATALLSRKHWPSTTRRFFPSPAMDDAANLSSSYLEDVMEQISEQVKALVGASRAAFFLLDEQTDELVLQKPAIGYRQDIPIRLKLSRKSICAKVFLSGKPHLSKDTLHDKDADLEVAAILEPDNCITLPLDVGNRRIGVFNIGNKPGGFSKRDLRLAGLLSAHVGILIHNVQLLESNLQLLANERQTVVQLQEMNQVIEQQRAGLQRTLGIHDQLTRIVLDGQGLEAICENLGHLLADDVIVEDRFGNVISHYSIEDGSGDEGWRQMIALRATPQTVLDDPAIRALKARLERTRRPARLQPLNHLGYQNVRVVAPVVVGQETLGYVTVAETKRVLDELDLMAVERAAMAVSLLMMKEKATAETQYKLLGDLVAELIGGSHGPDEVLLRRAAYLGVDLHEPRAVMVIAVDDFASLFSERRDEERLLALKAELLGLVQRLCGKNVPGTVISAKSDEVIALATPGGDTAPTLRALADELRAEVRRCLPDITVSVGVGKRCDNLAAYAESYQQARRALGLTKAFHQSDRTVIFEQLGIYGVLFDHHVLDKLAATVQATLGELVEYDRRHKSDLIATLDQYLLHDCHLEATASAMHVHVSTLRYRLRRIEQLTGADLHDFEAKSNLLLALRTLRVLALA